MTKRYGTVCKVCKTYVSAPASDVSGVDHLERLIWRDEIGRSCAQNFIRLAVTSALMRGDSRYEPIKKWLRENQ
jgi:hypothetical protein